MSRYRLTPTPEQEVILREHCEHARFMWNLAVEQQSWWRPGRPSAPRRYEQSRQLTEARSEFAWLAAGSAMIQQEALADFECAMANYYRGTHRRPTWRKADRREGFLVVGQPGKHWDVRRLSRHVGEVRIPKVGWVRFRWSRAVPEAKSYRVNRDRAGRWHVAFAVPPPVVAAPNTGSVVGVDRGVVVSAALSTGARTKCPGLTAIESARVLRLRRTASRRRLSARNPSARLGRTYSAIAGLRGREKDRRKDWAEKLSTSLAVQFDIIRVEDLKITNMTRSARGTVENPGRNVRQKAGLNRGILASGWGLLVERLEEKAPGRVEKVLAAFTSQRCSACGHVDRKSRESQADFRCTACGYACNADVNAAINIAAGHAVTAREGLIVGPVHREPQAAA